MSRASLNIAYPAWGLLGQVPTPVGVLPPYEPPSRSNQAAPGRPNYSSPAGPMAAESSYSDRVRRGRRFTAGVVPGAGAYGVDAFAGHLVRWRPSQGSRPVGGGFAFLGV